MMTLAELQAELARRKIEMRVEMDRGKFSVTLYWLAPERIYEQCGASDTNLHDAVVEALRILGGSPQ